MGRDGFVVGVEIRRVLIKTIRIVYRSVKNHPMLVGFCLFLLFLYRSSPFLFSLLVSASPVLVCTAVLLGTLLNFGDSSIGLIEKDDRRTSVDSGHLKMGVFENTVVEKDESCGMTDRFTELSKEIVERNVVNEPLIDGIDRVGKFEIDDVDVNLVLTDQNPREFVFEKGFTDGACIGVENLETEEQKVISGGPKITMVGDEVGPSSHDEVANNGSSGILSENLEDYKSAEGSIDAQMNEDLEHSMSSWKRFDDVFEDKLCPVLKVQAAVHAQIRNQLESSFRSWKQLDEVVGDRLSSPRKAKTESFEDYKSAVDTMETHTRDQLESSMGSWKQVDSEKDEDDDEDESDSDSDGAESSSPDASLADILPMLDELDPLLEDESPQAVDQSRQSSDATVARSRKSLDGSIHSDDECDQEGDEEAGDIKSDADDDDDDDDDDADEGEETQSSKDDRGKSAISWTEDDQKNLMDLGTSEVERNQRLESLIARRRARKNLGMMADRNLIDFDGMDLQFPIAPISISRRNPFDFPQDSYDGLGPIPGSAPSVLAPRRNPFDLPYDSSEEKPDLMGDSFQEEFMELTQREASSQREPVFRRNETFTMGSSIFDFGRYDNRRRPSRFRPYFVPERTDSDSFSYSSLQRQLSELSESKLSSNAETDSPSAFDFSIRRQLSELSESKLSSAGETESTSAFEDEETKKPIEHEIARETEPSSEVEHASLLVEHGSESSEDVHSLSDEESKHEDEIELGRTENSPLVASHSSETGLSQEIKLDDRENHSTQESIKEQVARSCSSTSLSEESNDMRVEDEDEDEDLMSGEQTRVSNIETDDALVVNPLQVSAVSASSVEYLPTLESSLSAELDDGHQKEPVYDLSPQAVKKNRSSSSSSSDLLLEMSEVDSHHLSAMQRDYFVGEESKDHKEHVELNALDSKEDNELDDSCEFQFPVAVGHSINFEAPVLPQREVNLITDSFNKGLVNDEAGDDKVSFDGEHHLNQKNDAAKSENDVSFAAESKPCEDVYFGVEERDISPMTKFSPVVQPEPLYSKVEHKDESSLHDGGDNQFLASSSNLKNDDNNLNHEMLATPLHEAHQFAIDSAIHNPHDKSEEQELSAIHGKLEEVEVEDVNETINTVSVQEPEEFGKEPITDMEHSRANSLGELGVLSSDEKLPFDLMDIKEMDDDLLTELDAVGDFSVNDLGTNLNVNEEQLNHEVDFGFSEETLDEGHSSIQKPFSHDTFLETGPSVENYKAMREVTQPSSPNFEESHLASHTRDADTGLPVVEAASVEDIDAAFLRASEGEFQKSVTTESSVAEFTRGQVEAPYQESELFPEVREQVIDGVEEVSLGGGAFVNEESPDESVRSDITSVDEELHELADEKIESVVETETQIFNHVESLQTTASNEFDSVEPASSQIDRDIREMRELPSSEEGIASAFQFDAQVERAGFMESESLQINPEINKTEHLVGVQDSHRTERIGPVESEPLDTDQKSKFHENSANDMNLAVEPVLIDRDIKEDREFLVPEANIAHPVDSTDQIESSGSLESESMLTEGEIKENQEFPVAEANIGHFVDSIDQIESSGSLESESLLIEGDIKQIPNQTEIPCHVESQSLPTDRGLENVPQMHVLEENIIGHMDSDSSLIARNSEEVQAPFVVQEEKVKSVESDLKQLDANINNIQSHVNLRSESFVELEDQVEGIQHMEVSEAQASSQDHQFPSQQQSCDHTEVDSVIAAVDSTGNGSSSPGENEDSESNESHPKLSSNSTAPSST